MDDENGIRVDQETLAKGRRILLQVAVVSLVINALFLAEALVHWSNLGMAIAAVLLLGMLSFLWWYVGKSGRLRWLLFMTQLGSGAFGFLLGGLHLHDPVTEQLDPLCYWLVGGGLIVLGLGGYFIYSYEVDASLRHLRESQDSSNLL